MKTCIRKQTQMPVCEERQLSPNLRLFSREKTHLTHQFIKVSTIQNYVDSYVTAYFRTS